MRSLAGGEPGGTWAGSYSLSTDSSMRLQRGRQGCALVRAAKVDAVREAQALQGGALVGGLYGVEIGRAFCGESMFSRVPDASKVALAWLVALMRRAGFALLDCQFMTEHLRSFGAIEIPRDDFKARLAEAIDRPATFQRELGDADPCAIVQESTRRS